MHRRHTIVLVLAMLASPVLAQAPQKPMVVDYPTGEGAPETVTCRKPQPQPNSRLPGPVICKTNEVWAQYRKDGMDVSADGRTDIPSEKARSLNAPVCQMVGGSSTSNLGSPRYVCN